MGLGAALESKIIFSEHNHVAYHIEGGGKYNMIKVKFPPYGLTGDLGVGQTVKYYLISSKARVFAMAPHPLRILSVFLPQNTKKKQKKKQQRVIHV